MSTENKAETGERYVPKAVAYRQKMGMEVEKEDINLDKKIRKREEKEGFVRTYAAAMIDSGWVKVSTWLSLLNFLSPLLLILMLTAMYDALPFTETKVYDPVVATIMMDCMGILVVLGEPIAVGMLISVRQSIKYSDEMNTFGLSIMRVSAIIMIIVYCAVALVAWSVPVAIACVINIALTVSTLVSINALQGAAAYGEPKKLSTLNAVLLFVVSAINVGCFALGYDSYIFAMCDKIVFVRWVVLASVALSAISMILAAIFIIIYNSRLEKVKSELVKIDNK